MARFARVSNEQKYRYTGSSLHPMATRALQFKQRNRQMEMRHRERLEWQECYKLKLICNQKPKVFQRTSVPQICSQYWLCCHPERERWFVNHCALFFYLFVFWFWFDISLPFVTDDWSGGAGGVGASCELPGYWKSSSQFQQINQPRLKYEILNSYLKY